MQDRRCKNGFTLVELLVALVVTSVVLTAVATLAFALGTANETSHDTSRKQAQIRFATLRISELIRNCKLIYDTPGSDIVLWKADDNSDDKIDPDELVYIEAGEAWDHIWLREPDANPVALIPQCSSVQFRFDEPSLPPPQRKFVSISFDLSENGVVHRYQINAALRAWAGHLLNGSGEIVNSDDD
jgi:prepilin-type N-terminal cleavage/methylation domain-containing protein